MLCGLTKPFAGTARVDGYDVVADRRSVRWHIGYMAQALTMYVDLSADENIEFYARAYGLDPERRRVRKEEVVELTGIRAFLGTPTGLLSGGWQRRLALACALLHDPPIVFLDEPTAGIDPVARRELWKVFFRLAEAGKTFFITTHHMDEAERCSEVAYVSGGMLIASGPADALRRLAAGNRAETHRFAIRADDVAAAFAVIRALPYVRDAMIFGSEVHASVDASCALEQLASDVAAVARAGAIRATDPSLEDVLVTLVHERRERSDE